MKIVEKIFLLVAGLLAAGLLAASCTSQEIVRPSVVIGDAFELSRDFEGGNASDVFTSFPGGNASTWTYATHRQFPGTLAFTSSEGGKVEFADSSMTDGLVEIDLTLTGGNGNAGLMLHSSNYSGGGPDAVYGYYIGVGVNNANETRWFDGTSVGPMFPFLQIGVMQNNWNQVYIGELADTPVSYPVTYKVSVAMKGMDMAVSVNGVQRILLKDPKFSSGSVGFRTFNMDGYLDNLSIIGNR